MSDDVAWALVDLMRQIISGTVTADRLGLSWRDVWSGNVAFTAAGWRVVMFLDCGELDYIDCAQGPDGQLFSFDSAYVHPLDMLSRFELEALTRVLLS